MEAGITLFFFYSPAVFRILIACWTKDKATVYNQSTMMLNFIGLWFSKCGRQTSGIDWELVRNTDF